MEGSEFRFKCAFGGLLNCLDSDEYIQKFTRYPNGTSFESTLPSEYGLERALSVHSIVTNKGRRWDDINGWN